LSRPPTNPSASGPSRNQQILDEKPSPPLPSSSVPGGIPEQAQVPPIHVFTRQPSPQIAVVNDSDAPQQATEREAKSASGLTAWRKRDDGSGSHTQLSHYDLDTPSLPPYRSSSYSFEPRNLFSRFKSFFNGNQIITDPFLIAYIIKDGEAYEVPLPRTWRLKKKEMKNLRHQSSESSWYKIFAFMNEYDMAALREVLTKIGGDGVEGTSSIVQLKKFKKSRLKFWASHQAVLAIIRDSSLAPRGTQLSAARPSQAVPPPQLPQQTVGAPPAGTHTRSGQPAPSRFEPHLSQPSARINDLTPKRLLNEADCLKKLTTYALFTISKCHPRHDTEPSTWARATITDERVSRAAIAKQIKKLDDEDTHTIAKKKADLEPFQQAQVTALIDELIRKERDRAFEWSLVQLDCSKMPVKNVPGARKGVQLETTTISVYVSRTPRPWLSPVLIYRNIEKMLADGFRPPTLLTGGAPVFQAVRPPPPPPPFPLKRAQPPKAVTISDRANAPSAHNRHRNISKEREKKYHSKQQSTVDDSDNSSLGGTSVSSTTSRVGFDRRKPLEFSRKSTSGGATGFRRQSQAKRKQPVYYPRAHSSAPTRRARIVQGDQLPYPYHSDSEPYNSHSDESDAENLDKDSHDIVQRLLLEWTPLDHEGEAAGNHEVIRDEDSWHEVPEASADEEKDKSPDRGRSPANKESTTDRTRPRRRTTVGEARDEGGEQAGEPSNTVPPGANQKGKGKDRK
jgi:hypothetical protein